MKDHRANGYSLQRKNYFWGTPVTHVNSTISAMARDVVKVFAPASVANVAVGYDILGFALQEPGDYVILRHGSQSGLVIKDIQGDQNRLPTEVLKNTAGFAAHQLLQDIGEADRPLQMTIQKKMPFGSGLGSSAASAVAGVYAVNELLRLNINKRELLKYAVAGEQIADGAWHADNVAPSLMGGIVLIRDNKTLDVTKLHVPTGLTAMVIYPKIEILTKDSRGVLSEHITLSQHIEQSGNLATLVAALFNSDFEKIGRCLNDTVIEPQRAHLIPHFYEAKDIAMAEGALGFSISGAGPSMFALCHNTFVAENIREKLLALYEDKKIRIKSWVSPINQEGAELC